jgi:hypothetical protein
VVWALTLIDLALRSHESKNNLLQVMLPVTLYLMLFVDKYVLEAGWRLAYNMRNFHMHYQEGQTQFQIPPLLHMLILILVDDLEMVYEGYRRYGKIFSLLVAVFAIVGTGPYLYRIKPVL